MAEVTKTTRFRAFVAAARRVDVSTNAAVKDTISRPARWQDDIWAYYDTVPEVKFALNFLANGMQKVRFFAGVKGEDGRIVPIDGDGSPLKGTPLAKQADFEMARVRNGVSGQGEINRLLTLNLEAPGECHLHGIQAIEQIGLPGMDSYVPPRTESWDVRSVSEIEVTDSKIMDPLTGVARPKILIKKSPDDKGREFDHETETLIRFWQRHPRFTEWADSLLRGCMSDCEMLTLLTGEAKAISKSRHAAGMLLIPSELSFEDDTKKGDGEQTDDGPNPFIDAVMRHQVDPITDPSSPSSVQRLVISGPSEFLKPDVFRTIDLGRAADDKLTEKMDRHINRLARGLNVPVEVVMGHMSTTFSNAEQIDQDTFDDHFEPRCVSVADGYATGFLRPQLESAETFDPAQIALVEVGFDPSDLVRDNSMETKADSLHEHGAITDEAYRRYKGATEADAPSEEDFWKNTAIRKGIFTAELTTAVFKKAGVELDVKAPPAAAQPTDQPSADQQPVAIAASARRTFGARLAAIDRSLRQRLAGASDMAMLRALERAGNKVKTTKPTSVRAAALSLPARQIAAHMGPALLAEAGLTADDLLEGAWSDLKTSFNQWAADAGENAVGIVNEILRGRLTERELAALKARQAVTIDEAWTWLESSMTDLGKQALFQPDLQLSAIGELDSAASRVPAGVLREALVRAGGATGFHSANGVLTPTNRVPLGGIATGEQMMDTLKEHGASVERFVWVYGPARRRTFPPHADLDGTVFDNFDDAALVNTSGWPDVSHYYPGDHNGCVCDFEPVIAPTTAQFDPLQPAPQITFLEGAQLEEHLDESMMRTNLDTDHQAAVVRYTRMDGYNMNATMRRSATDPEWAVLRADPHVLKQVRLVDESFEPLKTGAVTHRGIALDSRDPMHQLAVGDRFSDAGFFSTSTSVKKASDFGGNFMLRVESPPGTPAIWMKNVSGTLNQTELELLLPRNTMLEVLQTIDEPNPRGFGTQRVLHVRVVQP